MPRRATLLLLLLLLPAAAASAREGASAMPQGFVGEVFRRAIAEASGPMSRITRAERVRHLLADIADLDHLGGFTLGRLNAQATGEARRQYQDLFTGALAALVALGLERYDADRLEVGRSSQQGEDVLVESVLRRPGGQLFRLNWRLRAHGASYRVRDVSIENVQLSFLLRDMLAAATGERGQLGKALEALRHLAEQPAMPALGGRP